jgi:hypothetical protein
LRERGRQVWPGQLPSSIARERQRSARSGSSSRAIQRPVSKLSGHTIAAADVVVGGHQAILPCPGCFCAACFARLVAKRGLPSTSTERTAARQRARRSLFGDSGLAQAFEHELSLGQIRRVIAHRRSGDAGAGDAEGRLGRPAKPRDRVLVTAEVVLRDAREGHPEVSRRIARTEAQGLANVSRSGLFGQAETACCSGANVEATGGTYPAEA